MRGFEGEKQLFCELILQGLKEASQPLAMFKRISDGFVCYPDDSDRQFFEQGLHEPFCDVLGICPAAVYLHYEKMREVNKKEGHELSDCGRYVIQYL